MKSKMLITADNSEFPVLRRFDDDDGTMVVLFDSETTGMVVYNDSNGPGNRVGRYCETWVQSQFSPFSGQIVLNND